MCSNQTAVVDIDEIKSRILCNLYIVTAKRNGEVQYGILLLKFKRMKLWLFQIAYFRVVQHNIMDFFFTFSGVLTTFGYPDRSVSLVLVLLPLYKTTFESFSSMVKSPDNTYIDWLWSRLSFSCVNNSVISEHKTQIFYFLKNTEFVCFSML